MKKRSWGLEANGKKKNSKGRGGKKIKNRKKGGLGTKEKKTCQVTVEQKRLKGGLWKKKVQEVHGRPIHRLKRGT